MRCWASQFDMTHALTAHFRKCDFNTTLFTNHTTVLKALIFTAQALIIFDRAKDTRTEQTITLRLKRPVVDGLWLFDLAKGPRANQVRRCKPNADLIELRSLSLTFQHVQQVFQGQSSVWSVSSQIQLNPGLIAFQLDIDTEGSNFFQ